ncbi:MAG: energy transducer TonB [Proteobacteria bacterium]|nr:energy transducer TonB [Pseudomonadota bacterium]
MTADARLIFAARPAISRPAGLAFVFSLLVHGAAIAALLAQGLFAPPPTPPVPLEITWLAPETNLSPQPITTPATPPHHASAKPKPLPVRTAQLITAARSEPDETRPVSAPPAVPVEAAPAAGPLLASQSNNPPAAAAASAPAAPPTPARFEAAYLRNPAPVYPAESRRRGEEGRTLLRVRVLADGSPEEILLHLGSGFERLDQAAIDAVRRWKFVPAQQGGSAIAAWVIVPIQFSLRGIG